MTRKDYISALFIFAVILVWTFSPLAKAEKEKLVVRDVVVANVTSTFATISFICSESANAVVRYGTEPDDLTETVGDNSMRGTGAVYVELRDLEPYTKYYFNIYAYNTEKSVTDDNHGNQYTFTTSQYSYTTPYTVYGYVYAREEVSEEDGESGETDLKAMGGVMVYLSVNSAKHGTLETIPLANISTDNTGYFSFNLGNLKTENGKGYDAQVGDELMIRANGGPYGEGFNNTEYPGGDLDVGSVILKKGKISPPPDGETPEDKPSENISSAGSLLIILILLIVFVAVMARIYSASKKKKELK